MSREYKRRVYKLGEAIEAWRRAAGKSQPDLAAELDVSQQTISAWESGTTKLKLENLVRLGKALDVSPKELGEALLGISDDTDMADLAERVRKLEEALADPMPPSTE